MIPQIEFEANPGVPRNASFWMPKRSEIYDEGIGGCRDTWTILDVSVTDARELVAAEQEMIDALDSLAEHAEKFERMADLVENRREPDEEDMSDLSAADRKFVDEFSVVDDYLPLGGLELGVAGLVYALAAVRIIPAASCRSHIERSWSPCPVVLFAATKHRAHALSALATEAGCGLGVDPSRPELLAVEGPSIRHINALAVAVLDNRGEFIVRRQPGARRKRQPRRTTQPEFDLA